VAESATVPSKPFCGTTAIVAPPSEPCSILKLAVEAVSVKRGGAATVKLMAAALRKLPDVPVMVTVDVPRTAELPAVSVNVIGLVALAALKDAVTPLGRPDTPKVTVPLKPFSGVIVMALAPALPCRRLMLAGDAATLNEGTPVTVSSNLAVLVKLPEVPVMVIVDVAEAAELLAVNVNVLDVAALAGLKDAVTPVGRPDTARFTMPLKPFCGLIVIVLSPLDPAAIESADADDARPKDGRSDCPIRPLIRAWPAGVPQPVARS
jgi:hypothetical protein